MADESKNIVNPEGEPVTPPPPTQEPCDTFYDDEGKCWRGGAALNELSERARDRMLRFVPADVTEHLVNSQKEFIKAGIALAESQMRRADNTARRAREVHDREKK